MKLIFNEQKADYNHYIFPYQVYAQLENGDDIDQLYQSGFLPHRSIVDRFYLARSIRIDLDAFELSSENRRISRKNEGITLESAQLPTTDYDYQIGKFALEYFNSRFNRKIMSAQDIKAIFTQGRFNYLLIYKDQNSEAVGYAPCLITDSLLHYAYPFYQPELAQNSLGAGMMLMAIQHAKDLKLKNVYLGTCYQKSALYKTEFKGANWFTGESWSSDLKALKELCE